MENNTNEKNNLPVVTTKAEIVDNNTNKINSKKPKKQSFIMLLILILIGSSIYAVYYYNVFFKLAPDKLLPYTYAKTYKTIDNETEKFEETLKFHANEVGLEKYNRYNISLTGLNIEISNFDNMTKGYLSFSDAVKINYYLDDSELLFNVNNSSYYSIYLFGADSYASGADFTVTENEYIDEQSLNNMLTSNLSEEEKSKIRELVFVGNQPIFKDEQTQILITYDTEKFLEIINYSSEQLEHKINSFALNFLADTLTKDSDKVYITYTLDSSGQFKNTIRKANITTNSNLGRFIEIHSVGEEYLLSNIDINYKLFSGEKSINIKNNFQADINTYNLSINDAVYELEFDSDNQNLIVKANGKSFIRISDDLSEPKKPSNITHISNINPFSFIFDIIGIDVSPIMDFYKAFTNLI